MDESVVRTFGLDFYNLSVFYFFTMISTIAACLLFFRHAGYSELSFFFFKMYTLV